MHHQVLSPSSSVADVLLSQKQMHCVAESLGCSMLPGMQHDPWGLHLAHPMLLQQLDLQIGFQPDGD